MSAYDARIADLEAQLHKANVAGQQKAIESDEYKRTIQQLLNKIYELKGEREKLQQVKVGSAESRFKKLATNMARAKYGMTDDEAKAYRAKVHATQEKLIADALS